MLTTIIRQAKTAALILLSSALMLQPVAGYAAASQQALKKYFGDIANYEARQNPAAAQAAATALYNAAYAAALERVQEVETAQKDAQPATEDQSFAWQALSEIYLSPYITPEQRYKISTLAEESLDLLSFTESHDKVIFEGLDHLFALTILAQVKYEEATTPQDYENILKGIAKHRRVLSEVIRTIEYSTKRPFTSSAFYATALAAINELGGQNAFYTSQNRLRAQVAEEEQSFFLPTMIWQEVKKAINRYGDVPNYSAQERFAIALCDDALYPLTKNIIANDFITERSNRVLQLNAALCLLRQGDADELMLTNAAKFVEEEYFKRNPEGTFITSVHFREAPFLRRRMVEALYKNQQKYGHKYVRRDYALAMAAEVRVRPSEQIFHIGTIAAEIIGVDIAIAAVTGGQSLTVSLPKWGYRAARLAAQNGAKTLNMMRTLGVPAASAAVRQQITAQTLQALRQAPAATRALGQNISQTIKNAASIAVEGQTIPAAARLYETALGQQVLTAIDNNDMPLAFTRLKESFRSELTTYSNEINLYGREVANQSSRAKEMERIIKFFDNSPVAADPAFVSIKHQYNFLNTGMYVPPANQFVYAMPTTMAEGANAAVIFNDINASARNLLRTKDIASAPRITPAKNMGYRGMALTQDDLFYISRNGIENRAGAIASDGTLFDDRAFRMYWSDNPVTALGYAEMNATAAKPIMAIFEADKTAINLTAELDGFYTYNNVPASAINRVFLRAEVNGAEVWGQMEIINGKIGIKAIQ